MPTGRVQLTIVEQFNRLPVNSSASIANDEQGTDGSLIAFALDRSGTGLEAVHAALWLESHEKHGYIVLHAKVMAASVKITLGLRRLRWLREQVARHYPSANQLAKEISSRNFADLGARCLADISCYQPPIRHVCAVVMVKGSPQGPECAGVTLALTRRRDSRVELGSGGDIEPYDYPHSRFRFGDADPSDDECGNLAWGTSRHMELAAISAARRELFEEYRGLSHTYHLQPLGVVKYSIGFQRFAVHAFLRPTGEPPFAIILNDRQRGMAFVPVTEAHRVLADPTEICLPSARPILDLVKAFVRTDAYLDMTSLCVSCGEPSRDGGCSSCGSHCDPTDGSSHFHFGETPGYRA